MCPKAVFTAVRRLRFGFLILAAAGEISEEFYRQRMKALASFAKVSGCEDEAGEILGDLEPVEEGQ